MTIIHAAIRICPVCGYEFPKIEIKIESTPTEAPILKAQVEPKEYEVIHTAYDVHQKTGKKDSVKITYTTGINCIYEWVFPETSTQWGDFYYKKFCKEMGMSEPFPRNADDFVVRPDLKMANKQMKKP
jgi:uncharacterized Zn finger protein (UPF0148 family)